MVLMIAGAVLALFMANASSIVRKDGSRVILMKYPTWKSEILGLGEVLISDWYIIFLFPLFFSSNFFYTYHFQDVNLAKFTIRTRSLNSVLYWMAQIVGASIFGYALDIQSLSRPLKARIALVALFTLVMGE